MFDIVSELSITKILTNTGLGLLHSIGFLYAYERISPLLLMILMTMLNMMYDDGRMRIFNRTILLKFSHLSEYQLTPAPSLYSVHPQLTRGHSVGGVGRL